MDFEKRRQRDMDLINFERNLRKAKVKAFMSAKIQTRVIGNEPVYDLVQG